MKLIIILILAAFAFDMFLTFVYANMYKKVFPDKDFTVAEANPIIRFLWRKLGLVAGHIVSIFIIFWILAFIISKTSENCHWFIFGVYSMMCIYHFTHFNALKLIKKSREEIK